MSQADKAKAKVILSEMANEGRPLVLSIGKTPPAPQSLPTITPATFNEFMKSIPNTNFDEIFFRMSQEQPGLCQFIADKHAVIRAIIEKNKLGEGVGVLGVDGKPLARKVVGLTQEHCLSMAAELVVATWAMLDLEYKKTKELS